MAEPNKPRSLQDPKTAPYPPTPSSKCIYPPSLNQTYECSSHTLLMPCQVTWHWGRTSWTSTRSTLHQVPNLPKLPCSRCMCQYDDRLRIARQRRGLWSCPRFMWPWWLTWASTCPNRLWSELLYGRSRCVRLPSWRSIGQCHLSCRSRRFWSGSLKFFDWLQRQGWNQHRLTAETSAVYQHPILASQPLSLPSLFYPNAALMSDYSVASHCKSTRNPYA